MCLHGPLASRTTLELGQWDEACFGGAPGRYRSVVYLVGDEIGPRVQRIHAVSRDFTFTRSSGRRVFGARAPKPLQWLRDMVIAPGGATACIGESTAFGADGPVFDPSPLGDFPELELIEK